MEVKASDAEQLEQDKPALAANGTSTTVASSTSTGDFGQTSPASSTCDVGGKEKKSYCETPGVVERKKSSRSCTDTDFVSLMDDEQDAVDLEDFHMKKSLHWHAKTLVKVASRKSWWHKLFIAVGLQSFFPSEPPEGHLRHMVLSPAFSAMSQTVTIVNAVLMGYETDVTIRGMLQTPPQTPPGWIRRFDMAFTLFFVLELLLRIAAGRAYFFVNPQEWRWHWLDVMLVTTSVLSDLEIAMDLTLGLQRG